MDKGSGILELHIRDAVEADAKTISSLVSSLVTEYVSPSLGPGGLEKLLASMDEQATVERIREGWPHLCAVVQDDIVGVVVVMRPTHLYHLFVHSEFQRRGIATRLFQQADELVHAMNQSPLKTVNSSLNAIAGYERFGFVVDGPPVDNDGVRYQPMIRADDCSRD